MFSVQRMSYFFAAGLLGTALVQSVSALPAEVMSGKIARSTDLFYKGEFTDAATGMPFDLYSVDASLAPETSFAHYLMGTGDNTTETGLAKRSWYDCQHLSNIQTLGCNTAHGIGNFVSATGSAAAGGYLPPLLSEASSGDRDNKSPRSVCLARDGDNLCVSWASYDTASLKSGESGTIQNFSIACAKNNGSSEYKTVMNDGGILFICVSNRADGCGKSVC